MPGSPDSSAASSSDPVSPRRSGKLTLVARRVWLWLLFVGLVAVASTLVTLLVGYLKGSVPSLSSLLADGDGFLVAIAISGDAIGRVATQRRPLDVSVVLCGLALIAAFLGFGITKTEALEHREHIQSALDSDPKISPEARLAALNEALKKVPIDEAKVLQASRVIVGASVLTAFLIILKEQEV